MQSAVGAGVLTSGVIDTAAALRAAESPDGIGAEEQLALASLADAMAEEGYAGLRGLLMLRIGTGGPPLLVVLVAALFRHSVEADPDLFDDYVHLLKSDFDSAVPGEFRELAALLTREGAWLEALLGFIRRGHMRSVHEPRGQTLSVRVALRG